MSAQDKLRAAFSREPERVSRLVDVVRDGVTDLMSLDQEDREIAALILETWSERRIAEAKCGD